MDSRTLILNTIKKALADVDKSSLKEPAMPMIWEHQGLSKEELMNVFAQNLKTVAGEAILCADTETAVKEIGKKLQEIAKQSSNEQPYKLGVYASELISSIIGEVLSENQAWEKMDAPVDPNADPKIYEKMTASLVSPIVLLADTGSCPIEARSAFERFLCYLSPACLVVAKASQLREHLPDAWEEIETKMHNPQQRGEVAIVTGPSRTADIEKKLVLGVHGPQKLIVFIIND